MACDECHVVPTAMGHSRRLGRARVRRAGRGPTARRRPGTRRPSPAPGRTAMAPTLRGGGTNQSPVWTGGPPRRRAARATSRLRPRRTRTRRSATTATPATRTTTVNLATHIDGDRRGRGPHLLVLPRRRQPRPRDARRTRSRSRRRRSARAVRRRPRSRSVGQHQAHVNRGDGIALPNKCRYCHAVPTTFDHADGVTQVTFGSLATMGGATPSFDEATNTCSNTYCHGSTLNRGSTSHTPSWTKPDRSPARAATARLRRCRTRRTGLHPLPPGLHGDDASQGDARERHQRLPERLQSLPRHAAELGRALRAHAGGDQLQSVPPGLHAHDREPDAPPQRAAGRDAERLEP